MDTNSNTHFSLFHNEIEKFLSINKNQKYFLYEINQENKSIYDIKNQNKDEGFYFFETIFILYRKYKKKEKN